MRGLTVLRDPQQVAEAAADRFAALAEAAVREEGRFLVGLSGGSTPRPTYRLLAEEPYSGMVDWRRIEVLWGDERCVPPDDPRSNYGMARRTLLKQVDIPERRVHRIRGELSAEEAAAHYRSELGKALGETGRFDLILLGLGSDGHTASLFPGTAAVNERGRRVVAVRKDGLETPRVTLTLPTINQARHVMFLVTGAGKAEALRRVQGGEPLPAGLVAPEDGTLTWLVDRASAASSRPVQAGG